VHTLKINSYTHRVVTLGILVYRDFLKYLITIQEFTICLNISIIHLKRKIKVYTKAFYKNKWYVKRNKLKTFFANAVL
jgi:hypothetical protein